MTALPMLFQLPIDEVAGLPLHPLVVHAVVVLVPLTALGLIVMGTSGERSIRYSPAVVFIAALGAAAAVVARLSGEQFRRTLGLPPSQHFEYGQYLPWAAILLLVLAIMMAVMDKQGGGQRNSVGTIFSLFVMVVALGAVALTVVTGHTGAQLVWG